jgi:hypothetical protein
MIEILDENLKKVDILRKYVFAQYNDKFREVGTFKINARIVQENLYLLDKTKEFYVLFDGTVFGKIENVKRESDSEHEQTIVLSGRLGLLLFTKRVIAGTIKFKGNTAQFVKNVIYNEVVKNQSSKRYVNIDIQYDNETYLISFCSLIDKQVTGGYVWDSVQSVLEQDKLGLYFVPIVETEHIPSWGTEPTNISKWKLTISAGKDRTKGNAQGNVPVVFSQSLSNIARTDYELDTQKYCNVAYVAGEGEEEQRKWYEVYAKEETIRGVEDKAGWQRNELWIDARDIQSTDEEGNEITEAEYEKLIPRVHIVHFWVFHRTAFCTYLDYTTCICISIVFNTHRLSTHDFSKNQLFCSWYHQREMELSNYCCKVDCFTTLVEQRIIVTLKL